MARGSGLGHRFRVGVIRNESGRRATSASRWRRDPELKYKYAYSSDCRSDIMNFLQVSHLSEDRARAYFEKIRWLNG